MLHNTMHNELIIQVQPREGVRLSMNAKAPGLELKTIATELDLTYKGIVNNPDLPEAYEALLRDAIEGDFSLSVREDELEASWRMWTPLLKKIEEDEGVVVEEYAYGEFISWRDFAFVADGCRFRGAGEGEGICQSVPVFGTETIMNFQD